MPNWEMNLTRKGYADALVDLGRESENVVVFDADLAASTLTKFFGKEFPERHFDMGIAEQGMVGTAAGMALMGYRPFVTSYAMFVSGRAWEFVRQQVSYGEAGVVVVGAHGGMSVGKDGPTHQCVEDLALMRVLPGMQVIVPCDYWETYKVTKWAGQDTDKPVYFRMGREKVPSITSKDDEWTFGKAQVLENGSDGTIFACGLTVHMALEAAEMLAKDGIHPRVVNMHTVKPIDREAIISAASETGAIVSAEEHSVMGGFGSAIAEALVQSGYSAPMRIIGLNDRYLESGPMNDLLEQAGVTATHIAGALKETLKQRC